MQRFWSQLPRRAFLVAMALGAAFIAATSLGYFAPDTLPPFAIERMPLRFAPIWLAALRIHVATAIVSLPLCLVLSTRLLQRRAAIHRWLGRMTGVIVLVALVPSGAILALHAKGGAAGTLGFLLSAAIVAIAMIRGVLAARRGDLVTHSRAMQHVVAQMSVAVTSRTMLVAFDVAAIDPDVAYLVALWVPVLSSALVVELLATRSRLRFSLLAFVTSIQQRTSRVFSSSPRLVRARVVAPSDVRVGR